MALDKDVCLLQIRLKGHKKKNPRSYNKTENNTVML